RGLITEFDDFMNHLSFFFLQCAFLFAHFNMHSQLLVAQSLAGAQMQWREAIDNSGANPVKSVTYAVEQRHRYLQRERSDGRESIRRGKSQELRNQIAEQHDDCKDHN